jgi:hypothetical protein
MSNKYEGMTVNERLYVSGLIDNFDKYAKMKDRISLIKVLNMVEITDEVSIDAILESVNI